MTELSQAQLRELLSDAVNAAIAAGPNELECKLYSPGNHIAKGDAVTVRAFLKPPPRITVDVPGRGPTHVLPRYRPVLVLDVDARYLRLIGGQHHVAEEPGQAVVAEGVCLDTREDGLRAMFGPGVGDAMIGGLEKVGVDLAETVLHWEAEVHWTVEAAHLGALDRDLEGRWHVEGGALEWDLG